MFRSLLESGVVEVIEDDPSLARFGQIERDPSRVLLGDRREGYRPR